MTTALFHKELYPLKALEQAVRDFSAVTEAKIVFQQEHYEIIFAQVNPPYTEQAVKGEFSNYVLMLAKAIHA